MPTRHAAVVAAKNYRESFLELFRPSQALWAPANADKERDDDEDVVEIL